MRCALVALAAICLASCAATPGEELGTVAPRDPVTPEERQDIYFIDVYDPYEGFNRDVYQFNARLDRWVFLPVVRGYERVTPDPVEQGVSNFFDNLGEIRNGLNGALQGRREVFGTALARFMVNSTVGIGGIFDIASGFGIEEHREDFGQTLGRWGAQSGPYLVLPILGPSNVRDAGGTAVDFASFRTLPAVSTITETVYFNPTVNGLDVVDQRHQVEFRYYQSGSPFEYDLVRLLYTKKREADVLR